MLSNLRNLMCFKKEPNTPMGFCDGPSSKTGSWLCCNCTTEDRFQQPYDPENKFHEAVCEGRIKAVLRLLSKKKFNINDKDERKRTALHFACFYGHLHLVHFFLHNECDINAVDDQKSTPLMKAVQSWESKIVSVLLDNEADPNIKDFKGETALHHAVYVNRPDIVSSLLESGGNIEETTKDGFTPLLLALQERKLLMAEHLITCGANVYARDDFQRTTLMYAVKWDSEDLVELLLKKGVDCSLKDLFGWSALQYATAGKRKVASIILEYEDSLFLSQQNISLGNQREVISPSEYYLKSESLMSVYSKAEAENSFETQEASRKAVCLYSRRNDTEKNEINQVWANKCPHPELRGYSHPISTPESKPQQSEPDTEEQEEEIPKSKLEKKRSFEKNTENQKCNASEANGQQEAYVESPHSSNMNNSAEKNVIRHLEKKTVMEDQKQISEEQRQRSGRKTKWPLDS